MKLYSNDPALPSLPVPELQATSAAIPELVAPLVDAPTLAATRTALADFTRPGGPGEVLQSALKERAASLPGNDSWLRPFWDDMYTAWRGTLPLDMNYVFRLSAQRWGGSAALPRFVRALAVVFDQLGREELEADRTKAGFQAMDQARTCVYTRIPGAANDILLPVPLSDPLSVAVVCAGHWFLLRLRSRGGVLADETALAGTFAAIRKQAADLPSGPGVAAMTVMPRAEAAAVRAELQESLQNRISLAALEKAAFVICLDEAHASPEDLGLRLLGGDAASRWFDKSLQIIATENGGLGVNFEHAGCDAAIWLYLLGKTDALISRTAESVAPGSEGASDSAVPGQGADEDTFREKREDAYRLLRWEAAPSLERRLTGARRDFAARMTNLDLVCREFSAFSRDKLKDLGTSPDAFLQIAFQIAQYQVFGKLRSSYEAISVRGFAQGRTEAARGSTADALALAIALHKETPPEKLLELYHEAERSHIARLKRCQRGLGVERHMSGLRAMFDLYGKALGMEKAPAIFSDPGWNTLKRDAVSTSGIGAPFIRFFGFGPVVRDGFGVGYAPDAGATGLMVTAYKDGGYSAERFVATFEQAAESLAALLRNAKHAAG